LLSLFFARAIKNILNTFVETLAGPFDYSLIPAYLLSLFFARAIKNILNTFVQTLAGPFDYSLIPAYQ